MKSKFSFLLAYRSETAGITDFLSAKAAYKRDKHAFETLYQQMHKIMLKAKMEEWKQKSFVDSN